MQFLSRTFLFVVFLLAPCCSPAQQYKYLVLKGGGIRGIAYTGAFKVLEEQQITPSIEKVAGTSVGAITGALFCVSYTAQQMEEIMFGLDIKTFNDGRGYFIGGQKRVRKNFGWYRGQKLERWIGEQIREQTGDESITFMQLHQLTLKNKKFRDLYVTATILTKQSLEIFSWETYPDMPVKTAVRISVSVPLYFGAVFMDSAGKIIEKPKKEGHYNVFVDGGLLANYPINIFNSNHENTSTAINEYTLGLKLDRPEQIVWYENNTGIAPYDIHSFTGYLGALYNLIIEQLNKSIPYNEEKKHTIYISTSNLSPRVRHITKEQKQLLFNNGADAAMRFLEEKNR